MFIGHLHFKLFSTRLWQYRVAPLADTRTDDLRLAPLQPSGFTQWLGPNVPDAAPPPDEHTTNASLVGSGGVYETATALHAANVDSAALTRTLVFQNNVGVVTFGRTADNTDLTVQMALYFVVTHEYTHHVHGHVLQAQGDTVPHAALKSGKAFVRSEKRHSNRGF